MLSYYILTQELHHLSCESYLQKVPLHTSASAVQDFNYVLCRGCLFHVRCFTVVGDFGYVSRDEQQHPLHSNE